jgi:hypothetical protein
MNTDKSTSSNTQPGRLRAWFFRTLFPGEAARIEQLDVQLAGCATAALGWGERIERSAYGWSPAYDDILKLRDRLLKLTSLQQAEVAATMRRPEQLTPEELTAAFDIEADHDLWCAVHQVLDGAIQEAVEASATNPAGGKFTPDDRSFAAGGVDTLRDLQRTLANHRATARVRAAAAKAGEAES